MVVGPRGGHFLLAMKGYKSVIVRALIRYPSMVVGYAREIIQKSGRVLTLNSDQVRLFTTENNLF